MSMEGKYVRRYRESDEEVETEDNEELPSVGRYVRAPEFVVEENSKKSPDQYVQNETTSNLFKENEMLKRQLAELTKSVAVITARNSQAPDTEANEAEESWTTARFLPSPHSYENTTSIRWDQMKSFPKSIPANKMWEEWTKYIENFEIAASLSNATDPVRRSQLLFLSMGEELQGIVRAAKLRPNLNDRNCYTIFMKNVENHLRSMTDTAVEHEAFSNMHQERGETIVGFHSRLMEKVFSILTKGMSNRELAKTARTFGHEINFIVQSATRDEAYQPGPSQTVDIYDSGINHLNERGAWRGGFKRPMVKREGRSRPTDGPYNKRSRFNNRFGGNQQRLCPRCNRWMHKNQICPALKLKCNECGIMGHFAVVCRKKRVHAIFDTGSQSDVTNVAKEEELNALSFEDVLIKCRVGSSSPTLFLIDSGADVNVVGGSDWLCLQQEYLSEKAELNPIEISSHRDLRAYASGVPMKIESAFRARIEPEGFTQSVIADFLVVMNGKRSLLGRTTASDLKLLFVSSQINGCEDSMDKKFPKMPGVKIKFSVDKSVAPTRNAYYNIPAAYREGARRRLLEMEESGIIERVITAPEWISGMSAVAKGKNDFRLVVNMRAPNRAIKREYFRLPILDEMKIKLHGAKYFTKLDLKSAYYHLELSQESRDLTTFLAENGMFRFTRLMFGVNCAPEIFQREMVRILETIENKIVYIDDILIFEENLEDLHKTVAQVLEILKANNLTLNLDKCEYDKTRVTFLGHELDQNGFHIEEAKIGAIQKFRRPSTSSELRSFLGLASFVSPYLKNFANVSSPLWALVGSKVWTWDKRHEEAFNIMKDQIINCTVSLGYFSEQEDTVLYTDASPNALGAVLVQESAEGKSRIISFASKALTDTEKRYAQNQREALAAVWAVEHFSYFLLDH
ncbi:uncharacterized protein LOC134207247 [Armigeres subalbatus]|uniref:uncharacterized protein LOC134207247 n=1 Tax=Armigeres subalbatus TaxID=124917 RepID=UPI002ED52DC7